MTDSRTYHLITYGCAANQADSESITALLEEAGYRPDPNSDFVILNTCTVKGPTEQRIRGEITQLKSEGKQLLVAGCLPQADRRSPFLQGMSLIGPHSLSEVVEASDRTREGEKVQLLSRRARTEKPLPQQRKNSSVSILPISQGCLSSCTFCKTKHARGNLSSFPIGELVRRAREDLDSGAQEIWLTSQDCSAYGLDRGTDLVMLLEALLEITGDFRIRIGMGNPEHFIPLIDRLLPLFSNEKLFRFLHIPVQSGSDAVLQEMGRDYGRAESEELLRKIRAFDPEISLATDIICGFPTEGESDLLETLELMALIQFDAVNISRFWPRPGTVAARLEELPNFVVKERTKRTKLCFERNSLERNRRWIGRKELVSFQEEGKNHSLLGKNRSYKQVVLQAQTETPSRPLPVRYVSAGPFDLKAEALG